MSSSIVRAVGQIFTDAGLVGSLWADDVIFRAKQTTLYRQYYAGEHRLKMTAEMRTMMQIDDEKFDRYNVNYCEMVVDKLSDRLKLQSVGGGNDEATSWSGDVLADNRGDGLQIDVHQSVLIDGETFVMSEYDDETGRTIIAHEPVWDGVVGIIPVYQRNVLVAAAKVWLDGDTKRCNIYYPGETIRYSVDDGDGLVLIERDETVRGGEVPGLPLVAFRNRGRHSALVNVIPLQDSLNRTLISMVMTAELTAFPVLFARGWQPPLKVSPGMVYYQMVQDKDGNPPATTDPQKASAIAALNSSYDLKRIDGGTLAEFLAEGDWLIDRIADVTSTPIPSSMGGSSAQSGEALKQRESGLVGKAQLLHVYLGNAWEDAMGVAHRQQMLFAGKNPPAVERWSARWMPAEVRSDDELRATAKLLHDWGYEREALRVLSQTSAIDYSEDDIERLMREKSQAMVDALGVTGGGLPVFSDGLVAD